MQLSFTKLILPDAGIASVSVSISGLPPSRGLRAHLGPEDALMSRKPGLSSALRQVGSTYALGKLSDDVFEEGIKAAVRYLSSGAVAASARYVVPGRGNHLGLRTART